MAVLPPNSQMNKTLKAAGPGAKNVPLNTTGSPSKGSGPKTATGSVASKMPTMRGVGTAHKAPSFRDQKY